MAVWTSELAPRQASPDRSLVITRLNYFSDILFPAIHRLPNLKVARICLHLSKSLVPAKQQIKPLFYSKFVARHFWDLTYQYMILYRI
jgi:hypothetical protein